LGQARGHSATVSRRAGPQRNDRRREPTRGRADLATALPGLAAPRFARAVEQCSIGWLEEPVYPWDYQGCAEVARALDVPIATGENVSSLFGFEIDRDAIKWNIEHD
jgi:hypothetical protein